jgi:hypothetical protein
LDMYWKPTTADTIIPWDSCHPLEQKLAAIRCITNGNETYECQNRNKMKQ